MCSIFDRKAPIGIDKASIDAIIQYVCYTYGGLMGKIHMSSERSAVKDFLAQMKRSMYFVFLSTLQNTQSLYTRIEGHHKIDLK